jgi:response regulator NasT
MHTNSSNKNNYHILLVDDERVVLAILGLGLTKAGYNVTTAESVDEAEALLMENDQPDLAIIDISMPDRSGLELAEILGIEQIPFLLLTAISDQGIVDKVTRLGALSYLVKPVTVQQLIPAIDAALARAEELGSLKKAEVQLKTALNGARELNIAIGITIVKHHISRKAAFELLRTTARQQSRKLADIAAELIVENEPLI